MNPTITITCHLGERPSSSDRIRRFDVPGCDPLVGLCSWACPPRSANGGAISAGERSSVAADSLLTPSTRNKERCHGTAERVREAVCAGFAGIYSNRSNKRSPDGVGRTLRGTRLGLPSGTSNQDSSVGPIDPSSNAHGPRSVGCGSKPP